MGRVVLGAEQTLLLGGDEEEEDRTPRALGQGGERLRQGEELGAAGGVVERAVVDRVALLVGCGDTEMVVVGGVDHDFLAEAGIRARQQAGDVRGFDLSDLVLERQARAHTERHRAERLRLRGFDQQSELLPPSDTSRSAALFVVQPATCDARLVARRELELLAGPGGLHDLERVAGGGRGVDDDRAGRALARRALVLVGPAAVVEPSLAGEECRRPSPGRC